METIAAILSRRRADVRNWLGSTEGAVADTTYMQELSPLGRLAVLAAEVK